MLCGIVLAALGCGRTDPGGVPDPELSTATGKPAPPAEGSLQCGQAFSATVGGGPMLKGNFPASAKLADRKISGTVDVSSQVAIRGVASPQAEVFLVKDGRIVTLPPPSDAIGIRVELSPGQVTQLPGEANLVACQDGRSLSAGTYQMYARLVIMPDSGAKVEAIGGPWPVQVS